MKKILAIMLSVMAITITAQGQDRKVGETFGDGYMNFRVISLDPAEVEVAESPEVSGIVEIPAEIEDLGTVYKVTKIGNLAFYIGTGKDENTNITGVVIPEGIVEIGYQAFIGCRYIKELHLPSTLKKIGNAAFYTFNDKPSKLRKVIIDAVEPPACGEMVFGSRFNAKEGNDRDSIVLYVPVGSVQAYRAQKQWDYFNYIVDVEGQESSTVEEKHYDSDPDADGSGSGSGNGDNSGSYNQGLNDVQTGIKARKYYENGQLVIEKNGVKFNVLGSQVN